MTPDANDPRHLGPYDLLSKLSDSGTGTLYRAVDRNTGTAVAVWVCPTASAVWRQRLEHEFRVRRVLDHPNVVRVLDFSSAPPHPYLVLEYVDGVEVARRIEARGAYPESVAVGIVAQVCAGLQHAHSKGVVHRDLTPSHILVSCDGIAKLTGFDLPIESDLNEFNLGRGLGTPVYMAPEQFRNAKTVDVRGDIYSLGATLYAMVTGVVPFDTSPLDCWMKKIRNEFPSPKELNPALSDRVDWAIRRAMSAEPSQRPSSCREFLEDLTGQTPIAPAPSPTANNVWYLIYRDENNQPHTVRGSTDGIGQAIRDRLLGDPSLLMISPTRNGPFVPIFSVPEFCNLADSS